MDKLLIVDDEINEFKKALEEVLDKYELSYAVNGEEGMKIVDKDPSISLVLLDIRMPPLFAKIKEREGVEVLKRIKKAKPDLPVIMLTVLSDVDLIVETIQEGAYHYITKPPDLKKLVTLVEKALEHGRLKGEVAHFRQVIDVRDWVETSRGRYKSRTSFGEIIGSAETMQDVYNKIEKVSQVDVTILIRGLTGSGKELVASEIHRRSRRKKKPFIPINCSAIPENLLESELFGVIANYPGLHNKQALTGKFVLANGGTVFLDEIADMDPRLQSKILRFLQDRRVTPLGAKETRAVDIRIISATNKNLEQLREEKKFRDDLYYRLNVICIDLPALKDRKEDIPLLCQHFLTRYNKEYHKNIARIAPAALSKLQEHEWPGNVRELENAIQKAVAMAEGGVLVVDELESSQPSSGTVDVESLWQSVKDKSLIIDDLTTFRNKYGSEVLKGILKRAIKEEKDLREAGRLIGFIPESGDEDRYDNLRQWMRRLGLSKKMVLKDRW